MDEPLKIYKLEEHDDVFEATHIQYVGDILKMNQEARKYQDEWWKKGEVFRQVARIPLAEYLEWERNGIVHDDELFKKFLRNNPQYLTTTKRF